MARRDREAHPAAIRRPSKAPLVGLLSASALIATASSLHQALFGFVSAPRRLAPRGAGSHVALLAERANFFVTKDSNVRKVGKWISCRIEEQEGTQEPDVHLETVGPYIPSALKAVIVARRNLQDKGELVTFAKWGLKESNEDLKFIDWSFRLLAAPVSWDPTLDALKVGASTNVGKLAGAIASRINEKGQAMITSVGPKPTMQAVKAVLASQKYLAEEDEDATLGIVPRWENVTRAGGKQPEDYVTACAIRVVKL